VVRLLLQQVQLCGRGRSWHALELRLQESLLWRLLRGLHRLEHLRLLRHHRLALRPRVQHRHLHHWILALRSGGRGGLLGGWGLLDLEHGEGLREGQELLLIEEECKLILLLLRLGLLL
jgi:hypothetical protein